MLKPLARHDNMKDVLLDDLNHAQKEAVTYGEGPLLIVAGAGTGKTTVITRRIAWLIREGKAKGDEILGLTFTDKSAGEMEERVDRLLPMGYVDLWLNTFHSFGDRILKQHAIDIGLPNDFKLLNQTGQWLMVRRNFQKFDLDYYRPLGNPTKFIHALLKHFSRAKDEGVSADEYLDFVERMKGDADVGEATGGEVIKKKVKTQNSKLKAQESLRDNSVIVEGEVGRLEEIAKAYKVYEQLLLDEGCLDFGDLILYCLTLLRTRPKILEQYRNQFKYILVDEFQDTNWAQYELVRLLSAPRENLTVVADDDQSIYRFRGAAMSNILQFEKDYPHATFVVLTENYRSCQGILDLSYQFIQKNNPNRLESRNVRASGRQRIVKKLKAGQAGTAVISLLQAKAAEDEIGMVTDKIVELKKENSGLTWNDFAILVRANSQADAFVQALSRQGIPCQYVASRGLYAKPIILDIVNWLKLLDNYHESPSMWRVLNAPPIAMPWSDVTELTGYARQKSISLYESLKRAATVGTISDTGKKVAERVCALIERETPLSRTLSTGKIVMQFLEESGYLKHCARLPEGEAKEQFSHLNQFFKILRTFEQSVQDPSPRQFLEAHHLEIESGDAGALAMDPEEGPEQVKVMTVHAAKGLEFHTVCVVQMVDKRFPSIERGDPIELPQGFVKEFVPVGDIHLEEERRLLYVAMTRAKMNLFFTCAEDYGGARKKKPSVFLGELGLGGEVAEKATHADTSYRTYRSHKIGESERAGHLQPYQLPAKFSFTQLKAFETCPYQYRFAHILKVPVRGRYTFSFGKTMHATLQRFFELMREGGAQQGLFSSGGSSRSATTLPSLKVLLELYEKNWIDDWYESVRAREEYKEKGKRILEGFYERVAAQPPQPMYLEQGFHLKINIGAYGPTPVRGETGGKAGDTVTIKGVIDRIDHIEGGVEIVDYKTGRAKDLDSADKDQLLIYQVAAAEVLGLTPLKLTYYYLDEQKPVSFLGTEEQIEKIKAKVVETVAQIRTSDFKATPSPHVCRFCDFKEICEFRQL